MSVRCLYQPQNQLCQTELTCCDHITKISEKDLMVGMFALCENPNSAHGNSLDEIFYIQYIKLTAPGTSVYADHAKDLTCGVINVDFHSLSIQLIVQSS